MLHDVVISSVTPGRVAIWIRGLISAWIWRYCCIAASFAISCLQPVPVWSMSSQVLFRIARLQAGACLWHPALNPLGQAWLDAAAGLWHFCLTFSYQVHKQRPGCRLDWFEAFPLANALRKTPVKAGAVLDHFIDKSFESSLSRDCSWFGTFSWGWSWFDTSAFTNLLTKARLEAEAA